MITILFLLSCFLLGALAVQHRNLNEWRAIVRIQEDVLQRMRNNYTKVDAECKGCGRKIQFKGRVK